MERYTELMSQLRSDLKKLAEATYKKETTSYDYSRLERRFIDVANFNFDVTTIGVNGIPKGLEKETNDYLENEFNRIRESIKLAHSLL
ncbi:hypothetical protein [Pseudofulvibacter geojedonensis]|uniref:Uncharacterized protein n=1 Tax=Pseudofulvibacter geojedonensis TaxID=1123758 RepID=A0ABW3I077_9FLAO